MGFTDFVVKYLLLFMNLLVTIISIILIGIGSAAIYTIRNISEFVPEGSKRTAIILTAAGCVICIISFLGYWGSLTENIFLLKIYASIVLTLTFIKMCILVVLHSALSQTIEQQHAEFERWFQDPERSRVFFIWEVILSCCGPSGPESYDLINIPMPPNCCPQFNLPSIKSSEDLRPVYEIIQSFNGTGDEICTREEAYDGCTDSMFISRIELLTLVANVVLVFTCVQLMVSLSTFYLAEHLKNEMEHRLSQETLTTSRNTNDA